MMDVSKRYEGTTKAKYFKRYDFWKIYNLKHFIWDKKKKAVIKNYDYIANSQCCGLYSYGKPLKESK